MREVVEGMLYIFETGCQWRHLPKDFPPRSTVREYFDLWRHDGTLDRIHERAPLKIALDPALRHDRVGNPAWGCDDDTDGFL